MIPIWYRKWVRTMDEKIKGYKDNRVRVSKRDLIKYVESLGYFFERQSKTKHEIYKHRETNKCIPISITKGRDVSPRHSICYS